MIDVTSVGENTFDVTVKDQTQTRHRVTLSPAYHQQLTAGEISCEDLIRRSFEFLLKREPQTMILSEFELPLIQRYFTDYESSMKAGRR